MNYSEIKIFLNGNIKNDDLKLFWYPWLIKQIKSRGRKVSKRICFLITYFVVNALKVLEAKFQMQIFKNSDEKFNFNLNCLNVYVRWIASRLPFKWSDLLNSYARDLIFNIVQWLGQILFRGSLFKCRAGWRWLIDHLFDELSYLFIWFLW